MYPPRLNFHSTAAALALLAAAAHAPARADAITDWNARAGEASIAACLSPDGDPLHESRIYAMLHLAAHDAVNTIYRVSRPYAYEASAPPGTSLEAAVAAAAHDVLVSQIPLAGVSPECVKAGVTRVENDYARVLASVTDVGARAQGVAIGKAAAAAVIARRSNDGSNALVIDEKFPQGTAAGEWRFTPGSPPIAFGPNWGAVTPFALQGVGQFRPETPYRVSCGHDPRDAHDCRRYAADLEEIKRLGSDGVSAPSARTADQTEIALFWLENSPLAWNRIARAIAENEKLDVMQSARLFALLNAAQADGYVASWATKFEYRYWRPVTAIHFADNDGNALTRSDAGWMPLRPTPPVPDYASGHALAGAAAAQVMKQAIGRDDVAFKACSNTLPAGQSCNGPNTRWRQFRSLGEAAAENGESRILVGFHFRHAVDIGLKEGRQIGKWTADTLLQPQHSLPPERY